MNSRGLYGTEILVKTENQCNDQRMHKSSEQSFGKCTKKSDKYQRRGKHAQTRVQELLRELLENHKKTKSGGYAFPLPKFCYNRKIIKPNFGWSVR